MKKSVEKLKKKKWLVILYCFGFCLFFLPKKKHFSLWVLTAKGQVGGE